MLLMTYSGLERWYIIWWYVHLACQDIFLEFIDNKKIEDDDETDDAFMSK
jgi:hypothetical protein